MKCLDDLLVDALDRLRAVDPPQQPASSVVLEHRRQLFQKDVNATVSHACPVVVASAHLPTADEARDELFPRYVEIDRCTNGAIALLKPVIQPSCLNEGARKPIQNCATRGIGLLEAAENGLSGNVVRQQVTAFDQFGSPDVEPQQVATGDVRHAQSGAQQVGLGSLTRTGSAEHQDELWLWICRRSFVPHTRYLFI